MTSSSSSSRRTTAPPARRETAPPRRGLARELVVDHAGLAVDLHDPQVARRMRRHQRVQNSLF